MKNYNTQNGFPFTRVSELKINYGTDDNNLIQIEGIEKQAILQNDLVFYIEGNQTQFNKLFSKSDLENGSFELINIKTGEGTGKLMSNLDLFIAFSSFIRKIQKES